MFGARSGPDRFVYFARRVSDGAIKIGSSNCPERRIFDVEREFGRMTLISKIVGNIATERRLHHRFREHALGRELFRPAPELLDFIATPNVEALPQRPLTASGRERMRAIMWMRLVGPWAPQNLPSSVHALGCYSVESVPGYGSAIHHSTPALISPTEAA